MITLSNRQNKLEYIDDFNDEKVLDQTYQEIRDINNLTFGYWPTLSAVKYFSRKYSSYGQMKILDIGCGDGETLRGIEHYAQTKRFNLKLTGIDLNGSVISAAVKRTLSSNIEYIHGDALKHDRDYDLIISSLTMHHMRNEQIIKIIQWMVLHANHGWFVSDLHRHCLPYYFIKYWTRIFRFNPLICHDAPLSVARSFKRYEWINFLIQAKVNANCARIDWYPNFRYGIRYERLL
jgi:2-polyprenyl-3-methyl-5-hydroxy-6-metoxy-1,4-benzoquinol methylase